MAKIWEHRHLLKDSKGLINRAVALFAVGGLFFFSSVAGAACPVDEYSARIENLDSPLSQYVIQRGEGELMPIYNMKLCSGDKVRVLTETGKARLRFTNRKVLILTKANTPHTVSEALTAVTPLDVWIDEIGEMVAIREAAGLRGATGQGDDEDFALRIPCLSEGCAKVAAGTRSLGFEWQGGEPPFIVSMTDSKGRQLYSQSVAVGGIQIDQFPFTEDEYSLRIDNSTGNVLTGRFLVVPDTELPDEIGFSEHSLISEAMAATVEAAYLASRDDDQWAFEGYLRLIPFAKDHRPAEIMLMAIAEGRPIRLQQ